MAEMISEAKPKRTLNKAEVVATVNEANELFGTDFELMGSWAKNGFSTHDIDLLFRADISGAPEGEFEKGEPFLRASALFVARKTGMPVDLFVVGDSNPILPPDFVCWFDKIELVTCGRRTESGGCEIDRYPCWGEYEDCPDFEPKHEDLDLRLLLDRQGGGGDRNG